MKGALWVVLAAILPHLPALRGGFLYDDASFRDDPALAADPWRYLPMALGNRGLPQATLSMDAALWGLGRPFGFHLTNLLLHAGAALAAYLAGARLLKALSLPAKGALIGACLFALHPLQAASVSYVVQRSEILAGLFAFGALACWLKARETQSWGWALATLVSAQAGMLSKDNAIAIPGLILATEMLLGWKGNRLVLSLLFLEAAVSILRFYPGLLGLAPPSLTGAGGEWGVSRTIAPAAYAVTELGVLARYLRLLALPFGQRLDYDWGFDRDPWAPRPLFGILALAALSAAAWRFRKPIPLAPWGLAWFLIALSPTSSFVPIEDVIMEHRVYTGLWGAALLAGTLGPRRAAVLGLLLGCLTLSRSLVWAHPDRLWRDSARRSPGSSRPWEAWGDTVRDLGRPDLGAKGLARALAIDPMNYRAAHNLGRLRAEAGRHEEAVALFVQCLKTFPFYPDAVLDLSVSLWKLGRDAEALPVLRAARRRYPLPAMLAYNEGTALLRLNRPAEAIEPLRKAVELGETVPQPKPMPSDPRLGLAEALGRTNRPREALEAVQPLLERPGPFRKDAWRIYRKACVVLGDAEGMRRADEALK